MTKCDICGLIYYWTKSCPNLCKNQMKIKKETSITLIGECMGTLMGKKTVGSKTWLNCYLESLSSEELNNIKHE